MIGRLEETVFDCPDPRALATFYASVLGMRLNEDDGGGAWVVIGRDTGWRELAFQRASPYLPHVWPDPGHPQQLHVDIRVDDVDAAERAVVALGRPGCTTPATRVSGCSPIPPATRSAWSSDQSGRTSRSGCV